MCGFGENAMTKVFVFLFVYRSANAAYVVIWEIIRNLIFSGIFSTHNSSLSSTMLVG